MFDPSLHRTQHIRLYAQFRVNLFNRVFVYCIGFYCLPLPWCILLHLNGVRCFYVSKCVILMTGSSQSLTDLLLVPCVPVHQHGPCVSVQNWFWTGFRWPLQPQSFCFSFINVVVLVPGLYEPSILIYVHCILSEGIMICHLPLQVLESSSITSCTARVLWWGSCWNKVIGHMDGAFCFQILFLISFYPLVWAVSSIDCKQHIQLNAVNLCVVWTVPEKHVGWRPVVINAFPLCTSKFQEFVCNVSLRTAMQLSSGGVGQNLGGVWPVATHWTAVGMSQESGSRCGISFVNLIMTWF